MQKRSRIENGNAGGVPGAGDKAAGPKGRLSISATRYKIEDIGYDFWRKENLWRWVRIESDRA